MCNDIVDDTLVDEVKAVVADFVQHGTMFSAWDVTKQLRTVKPETKHYQVRQVVRQAFSNAELPDDYGRTLVTLANGDTAFVYHQTGVDPAGYYATADDEPQQQDAPQADVGLTT